MEISVVWAVLLGLEAIASCRLLLSVLSYLVAAFVSGTFVAGEQELNIYAELREVLGRITNTLLYSKILPRRFASTVHSSCVLQWMPPRDCT